MATEDARAASPEPMNVCPADAAPPAADPPAATPAPTHAPAAGTAAPCSTAPDANVHDNMHADEGAPDDDANACTSSKKTRITRKRCDGEFPCGPCIEFNRQCCYTPAKRRGPPPRNAVAPPEIVPTISAPSSLASLACITPAPTSPALATASVPQSILPPPTTSSDRRRKRTDSPHHHRTGSDGSSISSALRPSPSADICPIESPRHDRFATTSSLTSSATTTAAASKTATPTLRPATPTAGPPVIQNPTFGREDLLREVNALSEKMTLVVSLDEQGNLAHISNLGHAGGLHLFRNWTRTFRSADGLVYMPDLACCHPSLEEQARHQGLFPNSAFVKVMIDFYFDACHPYVPFLSRAKIDAHLAAPTPSYLLLYSVLAVASHLFERRYRIGPANGVLISQLLMARAKELVSPLLSSPTPCLLNIQSLLLIEMVDRECVRGSAWLISGMAIRMALDLGLNLGVPESFKDKKLISSPVWTKTWIYCCIVDSLNSFLTGRSHMISDSDCVQDLEECLDTPENRARSPKEELIPADHFFVWLFKLFEITGKIGRTITSIRIRRNLPYSLPELHSLLSKYRKQLPKDLVYDFDRPAANSPCAVHINLLYLGTVIFLYRTVFACNLLPNSPLRSEYLRILESSTDAILAILGAHTATIHLTPLPLGYAFDLIFTVCVIFMSQDAARNQAKVVRILAQCVHLLEILAADLPLLRRLAALGKELLESITGIAQDCDRDRHVLAAHLDVIKQSEMRFTHWRKANDPATERAECARAFSAYLDAAARRPELAAVMVNLGCPTPAATPVGPEPSIVGSPLIGACASRPTSIMAASSSAPPPPPPTTTPYAFPIIPTQPAVIMPAAPNAATATNYAPSMGSFAAAMGPPPQRTDPAASYYMAAAAAAAAGAAHPAYAHPHAHVPPQQQPYQVVSPGQASLGILPPGCAWFPAPPAAAAAGAGGAALDLPTFPAELFTNDVANMLRQQQQPTQTQTQAQTAAQGDAEKAWEAQFAGLAAAAWPSATGGQ
ncbi:hypothetical protein GGF32_004554 [Allomyces javanicus]|nr:hypothetical protein GGF32_004554 [Allomyces javanicus]